MKTSFLVSLAPSFKKLNDEQKFVTKVEFLNVMRRITFCQPPYHVSISPQFQSYSNLPGPPAHTSYIGTLPRFKIPFGTHHKVWNDFQHQHNQSLQNPYSEFTPSPQHYFHLQQYSPCTYVTLWRKQFVTFNRSGTVWVTLDILWLYILIFVTKKMLMLCWYHWYNKG
jgi:hypothetical protein